MSKNEEKEKNLSDNELVKIICQKDVARYDEIIDRYQGKLFAYLYRLMGSKEDADDVLQDVFLKAYENLKSYDPKRKFSSWIYRISHNEAVNYIRRKSLKKFISWENIVMSKDKLEMSNSENGADKIFLKKERKQELERALEKLPFKYRQILLLRYFSEKSYQEISEILAKPINTVGTLISRAKEKLYFEMKKERSL
ncbi:MAG: hypothetical protein COT31_02185 [Candidatus Moranbacteria bacterium CG08_land_8_20_14_0_20_34_16]|nr:MAG: hypothetical protein COT31_02185 [Candidatus Moranbacteria bacterium CG08_land_8_20_14_0_20_34_16]